MSKVEQYLSVLKAHIGEWCCSMCGSGSGQPAATFREIKKLGYKFEEVSPNRWAKSMFCAKCGTERMHYKLLSPEPQFTEKPRLSISPRDRKRILEFFELRDAFTGASISSVPEIDHKTPWTRLDQDIDVSRLSLADIGQSFQLLTREHNLLKDRMCAHCKNTNLRPPFLGISYWYSGDEHYCGSCEGCGWYDGRKWRAEINKKISSGV